MKKMHCKRGHERTTANFTAAGRCRICKGVRDKAVGKTLVRQFSQLRAKAKYYGHEFTLSLDDFKSLRDRLCHYCGGPLPKRGYGLDRIRPELGYVKGNVRPCCTQCNIAKNDWTEYEFREWILRVYKQWVVLNSTENPQKP